MLCVQPSKFCPNSFAQTSLYSLELLVAMAMVMSIVAVMLIALNNGNGDEHRGGDVDSTQWNTS